MEPHLEDGPPYPKQITWISKRFKLLASRMLKRASLCVCASIVVKCTQGFTVTQATYVVVSLRTGLHWCALVNCCFSGESLLHQALESLGGKGTSRYFAAQKISAIAQKSFCSILLCTGTCW